MGPVKKVIAVALSRYQRKRRIVLAALVIAAFGALLTVRSAWSYDGHEAIEALGLALIVVGILGRLWCTLYIGGRKASEIVETGPYSVTRNPLYLFSSIAAAGVGAQTGSLILGLVFFAGCVAAFRIVIGREEAYLGEAFGEPYAEYRARVPRFWPTLSGFRDEPALSVQTSRLYTTLRDGLVFLVAIPAFELVEHLQDSGLIGIQLHLF